MDIENFVDTDGCPVLAFDGHENGSFKLTVLQNATKVVKAFDEKGHPVRANKMSIEPNSLPDLRFFNLGSAVRCEQDTWQLFSACGCPLRLVSDVVDFVGDGNILVADDDKVMKLVSFDGTVLVDTPITSYEMFPNGRFVLVFIDGNMRMFEPDGRRKSELVKNSVFMPDGCFVYYENNLLINVYRPDGILDRREIYSFEKAGYYYLFSGEFYNGALYNDEGEEIGKDYVLLKRQENFCLFEHNGNYELFNQFGKVATFSCK